MAFIKQEISWPTTNEVISLLSDDEDCEVAVEPVRNIEPVRRNTDGNVSGVYNPDLSLNMIDAMDAFLTVYKPEYSCPIDRNRPGAKYINSSEAFRKMYGKYIKCNRLHLKVINGTISSYNNHEGYYLIDKLRNMIHFYKSDNMITLKSLSCFSQIGHAFSMDFTKTYVHPFWLDFDCISCKKMKNNLACGKLNNVNEEEIWKKIIDPICQELFTYITKMPVTNEKAYTEFRANNIAVFRREPFCSLHIYVLDENISTIAYQEYVHFLNNKTQLIHFTKKIEKTFYAKSQIVDLDLKYCVDSVVDLGLPFSGKCDNDFYKYIPFSSEYFPNLKMTKKNLLNSRNANSISDLVNSDDEDELNVELNKLSMKQITPQTRHNFLEVAIKVGENVLETNKTLAVYRNPKTNLQKKFDKFITDRNEPTGIEDDDEDVPPVQQPSFFNPSVEFSEQDNDNAESNSLFIEQSIMIPAFSTVGIKGYRAQTINFDIILIRFKCLDFEMKLHYHLNFEQYLLSNSCTGWIEGGDNEEYLLDGSNIFANFSNNHFFSIIDDYVNDFVCRYVQHAIVCDYHTYTEKNLNYLIHFLQFNDCSFAFYLMVLFYRDILIQFHKNKDKIIEDGTHLESTKPFNFNSNNRDSIELNMEYMVKILSGECLFNITDFEESEWFRVIHAYFSLIFKNIDPAYETLRSNLIDINDCFVKIKFLTKIKSHFQNSALWYKTITSYINLYRCNYDYLSYMLAFYHNFDFNKKESCQQFLAHLMLLHTPAVIVSDTRLYVYNQNWYYPDPLTLDSLENKTEFFKHTYNFGLTYAQNLLVSGKWKVSIEDENNECQGDNMEEFDNSVPPAPSAMARSMVTATSTTTSRTKKKKKEVVDIKKLKINLLDGAYLIYQNYLKKYYSIDNCFWNHYDYFINTNKFGIFNTLTGTYMHPINLLYFNTHRPFVWSDILETKFNYIPDENQPVPTSSFEVIEIPDKETEATVIPIVQPTVAVDDRSIHRPNDIKRMSKMLNDQSYHSVNSSDMSTISKLIQQPNLAHEQLRLNNFSWLTSGKNQIKCLEIFFIHQTEYCFLNTIIPGLFTLENISYILTRDLKIMYNFIVDCLFMNQNFNIQSYFPQYNGRTWEQIENDLADELYGIMPLILHYKINIYTALFLARYLYHIWDSKAGDVKYEMIIAQLSSDFNGLTSEHNETNFVPPVLKNDCKWNTQLLSTPQNFWNEIVRVFFYANDHEQYNVNFAHNANFKRCFVAAYCLLILMRPNVRQRIEKFKKRTLNQNPFVKLFVNFPIYYPSEHNMELNEKEQTKELRQFNMLLVNEYKSNNRFNWNNSFMLGDNFRIEHYCQKSKFNNKRAMSILFSKHLGLSCNPFSTYMVEMLNMFGCMMNYNTLSVIELLKQMCRLNNPGSERRSVLTLIGPKQCGKSHLIKIFSEMCRGSVFMNNDLFASPNQNISAPDANRSMAMNSYLNAASECGKIYSQMLKLWTGGDAMQNRKLFSNTINEYKSFAYYFIVANNFPNIKDAVDEAVRERLSIFELNNTIDNTDTQSYINETIVNPFFSLACDKKIIIDSATVTLDKQAYSISNILYMFYCLCRNSTGCIDNFVLMNRVSQMASIKMMSKSSPLYKTLYKSKVYFDDSKSIPLESLIDKCKVSEINVKNYDKNQFKEDFMLVFKEKIFNETDVRGMTILSATYQQQTKHPYIRKLEEIYIYTCKYFHTMSDDLKDGNNPLFYNILFPRKMMPQEEPFISSYDPEDLHIRKTKLDCTPFPQLCTETKFLSIRIAERLLFDNGPLWFLKFNETSQVTVSALKAYINNFFFERELSSTSTLKYQPVINEEAINNIVMWHKRKFEPIFNGKVFRFMKLRDIEVSHYLNLVNYSDDEDDDDEFDNSQDKNELINSFLSVIEKHKIVYNLPNYKSSLEWYNYSKKRYIIQDEIVVQNLNSRKRSIPIQDFDDNSDDDQTYHNYSKRGNRSYRANNDDNYFIPTIYPSSDENESMDEAGFEL